MKRLFFILSMLISISSFASFRLSQPLPWDIPVLSKPLTPSIYYLRIDYHEAQYTNDGYPALIFYVLCTEIVNTTWRAQIVVDAYFKVRRGLNPPTWQWGTLIYPIDIEPNTSGTITEWPLYNGEEFHRTDPLTLDPSSYYAYQFYQL